MRRSAFLSLSAVGLLGTKARTSIQLAVVRAARAMPGTLGVYARTLAPGPPLAALNASLSFPTASIIKLLIMTTAYAQEQVDPGTLERTIVFRSSELIGGSDFMAGVRDGHVFTVRELIVPMIVVSDNTAANMLISFFGIPVINAVGRRAGMLHTRLARHFLDFTAIARHNDNVTTPADMGHLLYLIEHGAREGLSTIVSPEHCTEMLRIMLGQTDRDKIPAALPPGVPIANKTGEVDGTRNDVAVIDPFGDSPLILVVLTKDIDDYAAAYAAIHRVTAAVYASLR